MILVATEVTKPCLARIVISASSWVATASIFGSNLTATSMASAPIFLILPFPAQIAGNSAVLQYNGIIVTPHIYDAIDCTRLLRKRKEPVVLPVTTGSKLAT